MVASINVFTNSARSTACISRLSWEISSGSVEFFAFSIKNFWSSFFVVVSSTFSWGFGASGTSRNVLWRVRNLSGIVLTGPKIFLALPKKFWDKIGFWFRFWSSRNLTKENGLSLEESASADSVLSVVMEGGGGIKLFPCSGMINLFRCSRYFENSWNRDFSMQSLLRSFTITFKFLVWIWRIYFWVGFRALRKD